MQSVSNASPVSEFQDEGFFKMIFSQGGIDSEAANFLQNNLDKVAESLAHGLRVAEKFRETSDYDSYWPSVYGLEPIIAALDGSCEEIPVLPQDQWDNA
ncbi:MAG: hypothetical protein KGI54_16575 [Pseudomonadota bacterium]|nr:hypothetical protein [Pseudomonadota bacterium]